ncbi:hypothetical protein FOL47_001969 [Perkinsus chesapeaki]|uniref:Amidinotransferase n=1 Tax=Perkinsus chesapeaki TaxID=330153 RepID=A0A7J6N0I9_PERCH|nr:hypothetical protein FOL47_001969 [Perkinsus chesapeaki]
MTGIMPVMCDRLPGKQGRLVNTVPLDCAMSGMGKAPSAVIMVRPAVFYSNPETALDNGFQTDVGVNRAGLLKKAQNEFDNFVRVLRETVKVQVTVVQDEADPPKPDAVFPNNWFTTHADGTLAIYPMLALSRRRERGLLEKLIRELQDSGYVVKREVDLTTLEDSDAFLEGTGALVFDNPNRAVYVAVSKRATKDAIQRWSEHFSNFEIVPFSAVDGRGVCIYHTNVMLTLGTEFALVCLDAVRDANEKARVLAKLKDTQKEVILLTLAQIDKFAGNAFELTGSDGVRRLVMSETAFSCLTREQLSSLNKHVKVVSVPLETIEISGGSARCMLAANLLPHI